MLNAFINASVIPTERLKLLNWPSFSFAVINSFISGWSTLNTPIFAPLLFPPCFIFSVAVSKILIKETGPDDLPPVDFTKESFGRNFENEKPVPPPVLWIKAIFFTASNISSRESSTGRAKQALNCPLGVPAFIKVGELGRKSKEISKL